MQAVFDGHNDVLLRLWKRRKEGADPAVDMIDGVTEGHIDLPRARAGGLVGGLCAIYIPSGGLVLDKPRADGRYSTPLSEPLERAPSLDIAMEMAAIALQLERAGCWKLCRSSTDIDAAMAGEKFAAVLHMEGCEAIGEDLVALEVFYAAGLRSLGPVWSRNNIFAHGVPFAYPMSPDTGPGLTDAGRALVRECNRMGILIDLSHITEKGFWDVAKLSDQPLVASHSNPHALVPVARNLTDRQLDAIRESNGLVGLNFAVTMLRADGRENADTPITDMVRHIDYLVARLGIDGVAIGSDFDGALIPKEIGDASGLQNLVAGLKSAGYGEADLAKICRENWFRVLRSAWKEQRPADPGQTTQNKGTTKMIMGKINGRFRVLLAGAALSTLVFTGAPAYAETPADTLVLAWAIDDIITLDPAESFEISAGEMMGNSYDRLVRFDPADPANIYGDIAESWTVSDDGKTFTFKIKPGLKFASGNPLTAEDVAFSIQRVVKLDKSPAFILTQFGLTKDNVDENAKAVDESTFVFVTDQAYAPTFVLNCLTSNPAAVVDKKLVLEHVEAVTPTDENKFDNDFGYAWLKTNYAGSGPMKIRDWRANEILVLERNDNYYGDKAPLARVIYRHVKESATQRLLLETGDIDIARNLSPNDLDAVAANENLAVTSTPKGTVYYISLNQKNETLAKPEVRQAFKYLVDYDAIGETLIKGIGEISQTFLPKGMLGWADDKPFKLDVAKAKELLAAAGVPDGFSVTMDVRNTQPVTGIAESFQQSLAQAGIKMEIIPGDGKQTLTKYRARNHDMYIGQWGVDYWDPHSNADTFTSNPDNADDASSKTLAWRNAWDIPELTAETKSAVVEPDSAKRVEIYKSLQQKFADTSPFVMIYQQTEVAGMSKAVQNFKLGPSSDTTYVYKVSKN